MPSLDEIRSQIHTILSFHNGTGKSTIPVSKLAIDLKEMFDIVNFKAVAKELGEGSSVSQFLQLLGCRMLDSANVFTTSTDADNKDVQRVVQLMRDTPGSKSTTQPQKKFTTSRFAEKADIFQALHGSQNRATMPKASEGFGSFKPRQFGTQIRPVLRWSVPSFQPSMPKTNPISTTAADVSSLGVGDSTYEAVSGFVAYTGNYESPRKFGPNTFGTMLHQKSSALRPAPTTVPLEDRNVFPSLNSAATMKTKQVTSPTDPDTLMAQKQSEKVVTNATNQRIEQKPPLFPMGRDLSQPIPQPLFPPGIELTSPRESIALESHPQRRFTNVVSNEGGTLFNTDVLRPNGGKRMDPPGINVKSSNPTDQSNQGGRDLKSPVSIAESNVSSSTLHGEPRRFTSPLPDDQASRRVAKKPLFPPGIDLNAPMPLRPESFGRNLTSPVSVADSNASFSRRFTSPIPNDQASVTSPRSLFPPGLELQSSMSMRQDVSNHGFKSPSDFSGRSSTTSQLSQRSMMTNQQSQNISNNALPHSVGTRPLFPPGLDLTRPNSMASFSHEQPMSQRGLLSGMQSPVSMNEGETRQTIEVTSPRRFTSPIPRDRSPILQPKTLLPQKQVATSYEIPKRSATPLFTASCVPFNNNVTNRITSPTNIKSSQRHHQNVEERSSSTRTSNYTNSHRGDDSNGTDDGETDTEKATDFFASIKFLEQTRNHTPMTNHQLAFNCSDLLSILKFDPVGAEKVKEYTNYLFNGSIPDFAYWRILDKVKTPNSVYVACERIGCPESDRLLSEINKISPSYFNKLPTPAHFTLRQRYFANVEKFGIVRVTFSIPVKDAPKIGMFFLTDKFCVKCIPLEFKNVREIPRDNVYLVPNIIEWFKPDNLDFEKNDVVTIFPTAPPNFENERAVYPSKIYRAHFPSA